MQEQAPIRPILTGDEQKRIQTAIDSRNREIADRLARAKGRSSSQEQTLVDRIKTFMAQCDQAKQRGDYSQADALSERALILARELQGE
jgi:F0F1-type ATP synthase membrane subunit b/b'